MTDLDRQFNHWRSQLLDLSRRNRLIHLPAARPDARASRMVLALLKPDPLSLWQTFAVDERSIQFPLPDPIGEALGDENVGKATATAGVAPDSALTGAAATGKAAAADAPDTPAAAGPSITNQSVAETVKTLRNLRGKSRSYIEETGINALFLAFGFLSWRDVKAGDDLRSPLLLVPVSLSQADLFSPYMLSRLDDEVSPNHALASKLEIDYHVVLPEFDDEAGLTAYIDAVRAASAPFGGEVDLAVELTLFNYSKLSMYQDLGMHREQVMAHPVVRALAGDASALNQGLGDLDVSGFDHDAVDPSLVMSVLDGDSSQQDAVQLACRGASFVLQGPPGTGKSQTITNIIAEFLAAGKRVLFVSEKMAALEVVHHRLSQAGLGDFCLTLHRLGSTRREVLDQLEASLRLTISQATVSDSALPQLHLLSEQRRRLNAYAHQLAVKMPPLDKTVYEAYGRLAGLAGTVGLAYSPPDAGSYSMQGLSERMQLLGELAQMVSEWGYQADNPWWGSALGSVDNQLRMDVAIVANGVREALASLASREAGRPAAGGGTPGGPAAASLADLTLADLHRLSELRGLSAQLAAIRAQVSVEHDDSAFSLPGLSMSQRLGSLADSPLMALNAAYRADRALVRATRRDGRKPTPGQVRWLASQLASYQGLASQHEQLRRSLGQAASYPPELAVEAYASLARPMQWFAALFEQPQPLLEEPIGRLAGRLEAAAADLAGLERYTDYRAAVSEAARLGIYGFVQQIAAAQLPATQIVPAFEQCFYRAWLDAKLPSLPDVQAFRRPSQDALVEGFQAQDRSFIEISRWSLFSQLVSRLPAPDSFLSAYDEVGRLRRELAKKRKLMPTRRLLAELPTLLPVLKPCMMMSPLAVSTYLSGSDATFDVVLFDEASQVRTEDAICAIFRARQAIVVGDSRQLPPSDFFMSSFAEADDEAHTDGLADDAGAFESLLDEAALLPSQELLWHYRSRHESLIAYSNAQLYDGRLVTFPSAVSGATDLGVEYVYLPDGVYERGLRRNLVEAAKVAELALAHFEAHPDRSLGIVAFGEGQQTAIEEALELKRRQQPGFERFFSDDSSEPVFVKNLETVQGDERDTIIFSIGYGYDAEGRFPMTFGPLSRDGGERRLNVAITRARINVKLVGSIMPYDIDLGRVSHLGPALLRGYIDYAQNGPATLEGAAGGDAAGVGVPGQANAGASAFEQAVYDLLTSMGLTVDKNMGCSGYRLDMAVRHPSHNHAYAIGIECDGASYQAARTARDRDRQRASVLKGMGWTLYRVWSAAWLRDPQGEAQRLLDAVQTAIQAYQAPTVRGVLEVDIDSRGPKDAEGAPPLSHDASSEAAGDSPSSGYLELSARMPDEPALPKTRYRGQPADRVPVSDFEQVMLEVVQMSFGIDKEGLYKATALSYGWQRRGSLINERLDASYQRLLRTGRLREVDGRLEAG